MTYRVKLTSRASKELKRLPANVLQQVLDVLKGLATDPHPSGSAKLTGLESYRVRAGDYRILYDVDDATQVVEVWRVQHRKDVYRDL